MIIDSDQHLVEYRGLWEDLCDPADRHEAIRFVDDDLGWTRMMWRDQNLGLVEVQSPGDTATIGRRHERFRAGEPPTPADRYDDNVPVDHHDPVARLGRLDAMGVDEAVLFPNYGLLWERRLGVSLAAQLANMGAWNRWCASVAAEGRGRLHPVGHVSLRDLGWLEQQLAALAAAGVHMAMVAPALVDGRPLSHPDLDRAWAAFAHHGIAPTFHVADQPRPFDDAWYTDEAEAFVPTLESVFLWTAAALACTDLVVNGVLERHPDLRLGVVELSAVWLPMYVMMLDGGVDFTTRLNGRSPAALSLRPSEYVYRQVRVSSFAYELPERLTRQLGGRDLLMACSDYPHSEGTATPIDDYERSGCRPDEHPGLFGGNAGFLLGR